MIRSLVLFMGLGAFAAFFSCNNPNKYPSDKDVEHETRIYHNAIKFGDFETAIKATHALLAWDTGHTAYFDTLSILYFRTHNYMASVQAAQTVLMKDPNNVSMLQMAIQGLKNLGMPDMTIDYYKKLIALHPGPEYEYELAASYLYMGRYKSVDSLAERVLADKRADTIKLNITFDNNRNQAGIPLKAALYNLLGNKYSVMLKKDEAKAEFEKALAVYPQFELAKQNLESLNKRK